METINHEYYVSLEVAKLLKQAGFDWELNSRWQDWGGKNSHEFILKTDLLYADGPAEYDGFHALPAPTLEVAQRWLREVKNCYAGVEVFVHDLDKNNIYYTYNWVVYFNGDRYSGSDFDTTRYYEVAQEAGEKKALEMILEKGK